MKHQESDESRKPFVNLYGSKGPGLIVLRGSGVIYSNQTGGTACYHPAEEGVFVPLEFDSLQDYQRLMMHFTSDKYQGWCCDGIDEQDADLMDEILHRTLQGELISVDRSRLKDSHEAWVYVTIEEHEGAGARASALSWIFSGFGGAKGVLTWENSD